MKLHRLISYGLMTTGAVVAARSLFKRQQWEQANIHAAIMLDWDDVQAVATRMLADSPEARDPVNLLHGYRENGATHLSIPELTLNRLLAKGWLNITQGASPRLVYLQVKSAALADLMVAELRARLPHIEAKRTQGRSPVISFAGDLPSVAEVGLGFDPAHAELAQQAGLEPVARPIGYSWVQPEMINRTFDQAAKLGCKIVAVQGTLIPGHEFEIQHTVEAMRRNNLTYAYFRESRHQKGDWFLAKHLAPSGLVMLAHEFTPTELLDEDWHTAAYRWGNLAVEAGVRLCSVRFFRILHASDPLESVAYIKEISKALHRAGLSTAPPGLIDLTPVKPVQDSISLVGVGLSTAGAVGLAADLLPVPDEIKLAGITAGAAVLTALPFAGNILQRDKHHYHHHDHHHDDDENHHADHDHHHDHGHSHSHGPNPATAYAQKGLALASTIAFPAAAIAINKLNPVFAVAHAATVSLAGSTAVAATTVDTDYLLGIEEYRGYNLDWLLPLGVVAAANLLRRPAPKKYGWLHPVIHRNARFKIQNSKLKWLPLAGVGLAGLASATGKLPADLPASLDREHRHAHTHHLSQFQQQLGDLKMIVSPRPLRKWSLLAPAGVVCAAILKQAGRDELSTVLLMAGAAGEVATFAGFRQGQRPLIKTAEGRLNGWAIGAVLAGTGLAVSLFIRNRQA